MNERSKGNLRRGGLNAEIAAKGRAAKAALDAEGAAIEEEALADPWQGLVRLAATGIKTLSRALAREERSGGSDVKAQNTARMTELRRLIVALTDYVRETRSVERDTAEFFQGINERFANVAGALMDDAPCPHCGKTRAEAGIYDDPRERLASLAQPIIQPPTEEQ